MNFRLWGILAVSMSYYITVSMLRINSCKNEIIFLLLRLPKCLTLNIKRIMKKVFMMMAVAAAVFAVASCACCNNSEKAAEECPCCTECAEVEACDSLCTPCDSTAVVAE